MKTVKLRGIEIGAGIPKICVPIVGTTKKEILAQAQALRKLKADVAEWRVDWFEDAYDADAVVSVLSALRAELEYTPLLTTFRTAAEGGEKAIEPAAYADLLIQAAESHFTDLIDVELFMGDAIVSEIIRKAHEAHVFVVASSHEFEHTPAKEEILRRLRKMQDMDADILKVAVMPRSARDVLTLLAATEEMVSEYADRPVVTMSMAGTGVISRISGEIFGSAMTFGSAGKASAPGQLDAQDLRAALTLLHRAL